MHAKRSNAFVYIPTDIRIIKMPYCPFLVGKCFIMHATCIICLSCFDSDKNANVRILCSEKEITKILNINTPN